MLDGEGVYSNDIRAREIGRHSKYYKLDAKYSIEEYFAHDAKNYFIQYESCDKIALFDLLGYVLLAKK